jgi:hypothetical protein
MKFFLVGAELFHAEGRMGRRTGGQADGRAGRRTGGQADGRAGGRAGRRTDGQAGNTKLIVAFRNLRTRQKTDDLFRQEEVRGEKASCLLTWKKVNEDVQKAKQSKITLCLHWASCVRHSTMQPRLAITADNFHPGTRTSFKERPTKISLCLVIIDWHIILFKCLWSPLPHISHKFIPKRVAF